MMEGTHRVDISSGLPNCIEQHKTRVSELSIIDVNDPIPSQCGNSLLEHKTEKKKRDSRIQETNRQYKQNQGVYKRDERHSQQSRHSGTKSRHTETPGGFIRKQTHSFQDRDNSQVKAGPSQYCNKRRRDISSGSVGQRNCIGKEKQSTSLNWHNSVMHMVWRHWIKARSWVRGVGGQSASRNYKTNWNKMRTTDAFSLGAGSNCGCSGEPMG